jgi:hypothetical protein
MSCQRVANEYSPAIGKIMLASYRAAVRDNSVRLRRLLASWLSNYYANYPINVQKSNLFARPRRILEVN